MRMNQLQLRVADRILVDRLDWRIEAGECWCIIGRNGAGKSTLLRTLAGLQAPSQGTIHIADRPLPAWPLPADFKGR